MAQALDEVIFSSDGTFFGREWYRDAFDRCVDELLEKRYRLSNKNYAFQRVALEIGCYTGLRASLLARSEYFDEVIACDINDCSSHIAKRNRISSTPIHFWQMNVLDLAPELFVGKQVEHINFRRVGHFLSAGQLRHALTNIRNILSGGGLVSISFDDAKSFDTQKHPLLASHQRHNGKEIKSFMDSLGFSTEIIEGEDYSDGENEERESGFNKGECHIIASLPPSMPSYLQFARN